MAEIVVHGGGDECCCIYKTQYKSNFNSLIGLTLGKETLQKLLTEPQHFSLFMNDLLETTVPMSSRLESQLIST